MEGSGSKRSCLFFKSSCFPGILNHCASWLGISDGNGHLGCPGRVDFSLLPLEEVWDGESNAAFPTLLFPVA